MEGKGDGVRGCMFLINSCDSFLSFFLFFFGFFSLIWLGFFYVVFFRNVTVLECNSFFF